jgi:hypothetical protein
LKAGSKKWRSVWLGRQLPRDAPTSGGGRHDKAGGVHELCPRRQRRARIDGALNAATLLIPIVTPSLFLSPDCKKELTRFLERERQLGRDDLILPVYYISTPKMDEPRRRRADRLARVLASRQYADWRELRFEPLTSPVAGRALAQLAGRMRNRSWR